jgi:hypothetical protein
MALLARLDELSGGRYMTPAELVCWADLLAAARPQEAISVYGRLWRMPARPLPPEAMLAYASLLWKAGDPAAAADVCDEFIRRFAPMHEKLPAAVQLRSAALLRAAGEGDKASPGSTERLLAALAATVEARLDDNIRRDALRQYVSLCLREGSSVSEMLDRHAALIEGDAYLMYTDATRRWGDLALRLRSLEAARPTTAASGPASAPADRPELEKLAAAIVEELSRACKAAQAAGMHALAATCAFQRCRLLARAPLGDARAALQAVNDHWRLLQSDPDARVPAAWLRVELMMQLGLLDAASDAVSELAKSGAAPDGDVLLRLSERLADRFAGTESPRRPGALPQKVLILCNRVLAAAVDDPNRYAATAPRVGR